MEHTKPLLKLISEEGGQRWQLPEQPGELLPQFFTYNRSKPNSADKVYRALQPPPRVPQQGRTLPGSASEVYTAALKGFAYYETLQAEDGHFPGDYGGPMFLTPGLVIASYITENELPLTHRELIAKYFFNHQNPDGGWGLHLEGPSTMFGTVLQYVALRLLGHQAGEPALQAARKWILFNGGATAIPSWGKFYLAVLGVYEWQGCNSLFPEMWALPKWLPFHPSRYWCHARMVYLPMSYCYGYKVKGKATVLTEALKAELYVEPYGNINWQQARNKCAPTDLHYPAAPLLKVLNLLTNTYERMPLPGLRKKALNFVKDYIQAEDDHTNYINIGPVNQVINSICVWHACGKDSPEMKKHYQRWFDYLWLAEDGMKMNGYNGSQLWDTAFALQALTEGGFEVEFPQMTKKAFHFIDISQVRQEVRDHQKYFRHPSVGGWPFSTRAHGWPITDCTAEGLKNALNQKYLKLSDYTNTIGVERMEKACDLLLSFQNKDGGWASYELTRAPKWVELLNPSEIFGNIMIDYSYTECSSASIQALAKFRKTYPNYRPTDMEKAMRKGLAFLKGMQRADGSWYGSWAVCFTYGTWFGVEGLIAAGERGYNAQGQHASPAIVNACHFLVSKQNPDGGWGESFESCLKKEYIPHQESQLVNTAWALLALMEANYPDKAVINNGIQYLIRMQQSNGDFPQQAISGVFNHSCMITYTAYRNVFPLWAFSRYLKMSEGET